MVKSGAWKNGMVSLMLALTEVEIKTEAVPVHINHMHTDTQQLKYNNETPK